MSGLYALIQFDTEYDPGIWTIILVIALVLAYHFFISYGIYRMARHLKMDKLWFSFIPLLQFILVIQMAQKPAWWIVFVLAEFIPVVGFIVVLLGIMWIWVRVATRLGRMPIWGVIAVLIQPLGVAVLGYSNFNNPPYPLPDSD